MSNSPNNFNKQEQDTTEESLDLLKYWHMFLKRWPLALAVLGGVFVVGFLFTLRQPKLYKATATIVVNPRAPRILTGVEDLGSNQSYGYAEQSFLKTQEKVLKSRAIATLVAEKMNLRMDDAHNGLAKIDDPIKREARRAKLKPANLVFKKFTVKPQNRSRIFEIQVIKKDPKFASDLANTIANSYMEYNVDRRVESTKDAGTWLAVRNDELKQKLERSEEKLYEFMSEHKILGADLESQMAEGKSKLGVFLAKLSELQSLKIAGELDRVALRSLKSHPELIYTLPDVNSSSMINSLKEKMSDLNTQLTEAKTKYLPAHPKVLAVQGQMVGLQKELNKEIDLTIQGLERNEKSLAVTESGFKKVIRQEKLKEAKLNELSLAYGRLRRDVTTNTKLYDLVTNRMKEMDLTGALRVNNISILDYAQVPKSPFKPNWRNNLMVSIMLGLMLGLGLIFLLEMLDTTLKSQEDVEEFLKQPFLGVLPIIDAGNQKSKKTKNRKQDAEGTRMRDLYILSHPKGMVAECSRAIRTNLLFMSPDKPLQTMLVTSAVPKEGKTTTSVTMAVTMAQSGSKVLVVDADMRRPRLHRSFGFDNENGLSKVILGESTLEDAVQQSEQPGLDVLTCGPVPPNPSELLHTKKFADLIELLKTKYDKIIFDAPPVGAVTDPVILGTQVDGAIMIVKTGKTHRAAIQQGLRTLEDARVNIFGLILNDMELNNSKYGYYYGKYYRYGQYYHYGRYYGNYGDEETTVKKPAAA